MNRLSRAKRVQVISALIEGDRCKLPQTGLAKHAVAAAVPAATAVETS
jgi:hypothetical protein